MKQNKYGFTLIEILGVVVILGIIMGVGVAGYSNYIEKVKANYYDSQEEMLKEAGIDFFTDNRGRLPQTAGEENCVLLNTLINNRYIQTILDYNKKSCDGNKSKVCARKLTNTKYIYSSYLSCGEDYKTPNYKPPKIEFNLKQDKKIEDNKTYDVKMTITYDSSVVDSEKSGIASYRYVIYKVNDNNRVFYDTGWKTYKDQTKTEREETITLDATGTYKVRGYAYNANGQLAEGESKNATLKFTLNCSRDVEFINNNYTYNTWVNKAIKTTIKATGGISTYKLEIVRTDSSKLTTLVNEKIQSGYYEYSNDVEGTYKYRVTANDDSGGSCTIESKEYKIDKTKPTCSASLSGGKSGNNGWFVGGTVTYAATCSDSLSGCKQTNYKVNYTKDMSDNVNLKVYDNAGNETTCESKTVKIDSTKPTCKISKSGTEGDNDWYKSDVTMKVTGSDGGSGIAKEGYYLSTTNNTGTKTYSSANTALQRNDTTKSGTKWYGYVKDDAGNVSSVCDTTVWKDTVSPSCSVKSSTSGWTNQDVTLTATCTDSNSGCVNSSTSKKLSSNMNEYYPFSVKDKAGNTGSCNKVLVQIDKTKPTCDGISVTSGTKGTNDWYKTNVTLKVTGSDSGTIKSGVSLYSLEKTDTKVFKSTNTGEQNDNTSTSGQNWYGYVKDAAGNVSNRCSVKNIKVDNRVPWITDVKVSGKKITISAADNSSGVYQYCVRKSTKENGNKDCSYFWKTSSTQTVTENGTWFIAVKDKAGNNSSKSKVTVGSTKPKVTLTEKVGIYATLHNSCRKRTSQDPCGGGACKDVTKSSSIFYDQVMDVSQSTGKTVNGKWCWNCNTGSWNAGYNYITIDVQPDADVKDGKEVVNITFTGANNVGTWLGDNSTRKVCFTEDRTFNTSTCVDSSDIGTLKSSSEKLTSGFKKTITLNVPKKKGSYAIKIYNPSCNTGCDPGSDKNHDGNGIASFQTDYIIKVS